MAAQVNHEVTVRKSMPKHTHNHHEQAVVTEAYPVYEK